MSLGGGGQIGSGGKVEGLRIEPPIAGFLDFGNDSLARGGEAHGGDPERRTAARAVEGLKGGEVVGRRPFAQGGVLELRPDRGDDGVGRGRLRLGFSGRYYGDGPIGGIAALLIRGRRGRIDRWLVLAGRCRRGTS